jgi:hypothetical protein
MSDGSSMYTGSLSCQAVRINRSISVIALSGVSLAWAAVTCAYAVMNRSQVPSAIVWCISRPRCIDLNGIDPQTQITGTCSA